MELKRRWWLRWLDEARNRQGGWIRDSDDGAESWDFCLFFFFFFPFLSRTARRPTRRAGQISYSMTFVGRGVGGGGGGGGDLLVEIEGGGGKVGWVGRVGRRLASRRRGSHRRTKCRLDVRTDLQRPSNNRCYKIRQGA